MKDIWVPISGAIAQQRNVETIANNIANANTPGFKKDQLIFKEHLTIQEKGVSDLDLPRKEWSPQDFYHTLGAENSLVEVDGSYTIHQQGQLMPTSNPLDLAIRGDGFFEILTPNGIRYTRKGIFSLSRDNQLVNDTGHFVLTKLALPKEGDPQGADSLPSPQNRILKFENLKGSITINLQGEVFANGQKVDDLSVVEFKDLHALRKEGNTYYINQDFSNINPTAKSTIHQGFVESSNVNAIEEISALIKANRHFESIQRVIKAYDQITGKGVNEISKF